jgi:hypothetical protein
LVSGVCARRPDQPAVSGAALLDPIVARIREMESWLGLSEQFFRFDKWNPCRGDENDGPAKRDQLVL